MKRTDRRPKFYEYIKIARFDHWIKQIFIIPGVIFAFFLIENNEFDDIFFRFALGFLSTCFIASANYEFDQFHPTKKRRRVLFNRKPLPFPPPECCVLPSYTFSAGGPALSYTTAKSRENPHNLLS
jgi:hypothetical protein